VLVGRLKTCRGAWRANALAIVVLSLASGVACDDFTPETGPLRSARVCYAADAAGSYYGAVTVPCADSGTDSGANMVLRDAGVAGNVLIADQYNNRVIEVTREGDIVWSFGDGSSLPGPTSIVAPNDAERLPNGRTLIAGTGAPPGSESTCLAGCMDSRVLIVDDASGVIVWQYGSAGVTGGGPGQLWAPVVAVLVPIASASGDHILITDQGNQRVIEVSVATKDIVWQFPPSQATSAQKLSSPNSAERLANGNTLIADQGGNRVLEVSAAGSIVWQYPAVIHTARLNAPAFASRLPTGHTLITDSNNDRILEVMGSDVVWTYDTSARWVPGDPLPTRAVRLANGHTLITETLNDQVIEVDAEGNLVYSHGKLGASGKGPSLLNQPYDAKVVGDYTGLTPPSP
jgi:outer membrane protein assembly factor BamB